MSKKEWTPLSYGQVKIKDSFLCNSMSLERDYLLSLDADRLLAGFRPETSSNALSRMGEYRDSGAHNGPLFGSNVSTLGI